MNPDRDDDDSTYRVVVNHLEQYSIWPSHRDAPPGWSATGMAGRKRECLEYIASVWKDMRPMSVRGREEAPGDTLVSPEPARGPSLVERLSTGRHPVEAVLHPENTAGALKECLGRGYLRIRFPKTQGGTALGLRLDRAASRTLPADLDEGTGTVHLEGELSLNRSRVRCVVDLELATLSGNGHLDPVVDRFSNGS